MVLLTHLVPFLVLAVANAIPQPQPDVLVSSSLKLEKRGSGHGHPPKMYNISFYHINDVHA